MSLHVKYFKHFAHKLFRTIGYDFKRYSPENFASLRRQVIIDKEEIDLVLDIGANEGTFGLEIRENGYVNRIISFEPLQRSYLFLTQRIQSDLLWQSENSAIGNFDGEIEMNISGRETSSSILPIAEAHLKAAPSTATVAREKVKISRLDSLLEKLILPAQRIYLKADVQGYELRVMQGAQELLKRTRVVELELSLTSLYEGAPEMMEMLEYMENLGFKLVSISNVFSDPKSCHMLQVDGIFVKNQLTA